MAGASESLRASLREQLERLRGDALPLPDALLDVALVRVAVGGGELLLAQPTDWQALREEEALARRPVPYWGIVWPSGHALAGAVAGTDLAGRRVLELGCGLGLPSVAAARAGAEVLATDGASDAVVFCAHNLALNELLGEVAEVPWHDPAPLVGAGPFDLVLAADVLYTRRNVELLLTLLPRLVAPGGEVWLADPERAGGRELLAGARRQWTIDSRPDPECEGVRLHRLARRLG